MSTADALAAVTAVLRARLTRAVTEAALSSSLGGTVTVSVTAPNRIETDSAEPNAINLFLHRITRNAAWANQGSPPRDSSGRAVENPPVPVDLHYIVTAYGRNALNAEILIGHAATVLLDQPFLDRTEIRQALPPLSSDASLPVSLATVRLADQADRVRLTDVNPGSEEISRLWSSFQAPYRPSLFVQAGPVLLERDRAVHAAFPVRFVGIGTTPTEVPVVDSVTAGGDDLAPITAGTTLVVTGTNLAGTGTTVRLGASVAAPATARAGELTVPLASFSPAVGPGLHGLVVTHEHLLGVPPSPHVGLTSAPVGVRVVPTITLGAGAVDGGNRTVTAGVAPAVGPSQDVLLQLSEAGIAAGTEPGAASIRAPERTAPATSVTFPYGSLGAGTYVARLVVDGVPSRVGLGGSGVYDRPTVVIP